MSLRALLRSIFCLHLDGVRCTHGDEIRQRNWSRQVCLQCGASLPGPLPVICSITGKPHARYGGGDLPPGD